MYSAGATKQRWTQREKLAAVAVIPLVAVRPLPTKCNAPTGPTNLDGPATLFDFYRCGVAWQIDALILKPLLRVFLRLFSRVGILIEFDHRILKLVFCIIFWAFFRPFLIWSFFGMVQPDNPYDELLKV